MYSYIFAAVPLVCAGYDLEAFPLQTVATKNTLEVEIPNHLEKNNNTEQLFHNFLVYLVFSQNEVEIYRPLSPTMYSIGSRSYVEHCHSYESNRNSK